MFGLAVGNGELEILLNVVVSVAESEVSPYRKRI